MTRVQIEITIGIILVLATSLIVLFYGLGEEDRMAEYALAHEAQAVEVGAELFEAQCSRCHGTQGLGIPGLCPPLNDRNFFDNRMGEVGWQGTIEDYIVATASSGRLTSTRPQLYPGEGVPAMPSFHENFGGPLREDQIRSIATFIMNWEATAEVVEVAEVTGPAEGEAIGTDINQEMPEGDPAAGEALAESLGCTACHVAAPTGPAWFPNEEFPTPISERAAERIEDPNYTGSATTPEQYLLESIIQPGAYIVTGYTDIMPHTYSDTLTPQDVADLIAYMLTIE